MPEKPDQPDQPDQPDEASSPRDADPPTSRPDGESDGDGATTDVTPDPIPLDEPEPVTSSPADRGDSSTSKPDPRDATPALDAAAEISGVEERIAAERARDADAAATAAAAGVASGGAKQTGAKPSNEKTASGKAPGVPVGRSVDALAPKGSSTLPIAIVAIVACTLIPMATAGWGALFPTVGGLFEAGDGTFSAESPAWSVRIREVAHWPIRIALLAAAIFLSAAVFARVRRVPFGDLRRMAWLCAAIAAASALAFVIPIPWEAGRAAVHALLSLGIVYVLLHLLLRRTLADAGWLLGGVALGLLVLRFGAQVVLWSFPF